jgi:FHS family L-fucose permease-like MFS transporter
MQMPMTAEATTKDGGPALPKTERYVGLVVVISLFFMWGFITCLNDILIPHLKAVFGLDYTGAVLIQFTFFGAYFLMSLPAGKLVSWLGYKWTMVAGLMTAGAGTLLFLPAADTISYPLFLGALFILATGITLLQVSANPYISALGRAETASSRLNLAQAFNSLGTTMAPWFGGLLIFSSQASLAGVNKANEAAAVKMPYLLLTGILIALAAAIAFAHLPRIPAVEGEGGREGTLWDALKIPHLSLGALGIFLYVGAEVSIGSFLINYLGDPKIAAMSQASAAKYVSLYWGGAMVGRFVGSALLQRIRPSNMLAFNATVAALLTVAGFTLTGAVAMWAILLIGLFNSIMFPNIFTLGIRELGHLTGRGSSILVMGIVGGAIVPVLTGVMADCLGIRLALFVPALCYVYIIYYGARGYKIDKPKHNVEASNLSLVP